MRQRLKTVRRDLSQGLWFVPGCLIAAFFALGAGLVELDAHLDVDGSGLLFAGDGPAARTVLSVIAGSLITVAGLTFSITIVVLQLASSQFSPRVLRTFFGDRTTQITVGTFVGIFVYSLLVLRAVGSADQPGFVPRLGVTTAVVLAIVAVLLLIAFLHHVALMIQVSHVAADLARQTNDAIRDQHPRSAADAASDEDGEALAADWRATAEPVAVLPQRPGFVRSIDEGAVLKALGEHAGGRAVLLVRPGDFVGFGDSLAEVWPRDADPATLRAVREAVRLGDERDIDQDAAFGLRQLIDIALKAASPAINDPATAVTCVGYLRSALVLLTGRAPAPDVRRAGDAALVARRRRFPEHLDLLQPLLPAAASDPWLARELLRTAHATALAAGSAGPDSARAAVLLGEEVAGLALAEAPTDRAAAELRRALADLRELGGPPPRAA